MRTTTHTEFPVAPYRQGTDRVWNTPPRPEETDEGGGVPWVRYLDALRRNWALIVGISLLGAMGGRFAASRVRPTYEAQASIWINTAPNGPSVGGPIRQQQLLNSVSWVELLRSFTIIDPIVRDLGLNVTFADADSAIFRSFTWTPATRSGSYELTIDKTGRKYVLATTQGTVLERGTVGDSVGRKLGMTWQPDARYLQPSRKVDFSVSSPRAVSASLIGSVRTSLPEDAQFLKITLSGGDPQRAAKTVNAWAKGLVGSSGELKKRHLLEFKEILADQLALAETQLRQSENDLEQFRVNTITLPRSAPTPAGAVAGADPVVANYFQQKATLDEIRSEQATLERMLADAHGGAINTQAFMQLPSILNNAPQLRSALEELALRKATLRTEQQFLTDANPRIKQLQEAVRSLETQTIPQITRDVLASLRTRDTELDNRIGQGTQELRAMPARATEEMRLARREAASENLYNSLKARYEEVSIAEAQTTPDLSVLDTALAPVSPVSNDAPRLKLLAMIASVGLALALALIRDRLDRTFRYPEHATHDLGLSIAGTVPKLKANARGEYQLVMMSQTVESFRTLRLAVRYDFPPDRPVVLSISSAAAGDGKSLVSSNLALAFASAGNRTLLIDGDVRRGSLHSTFATPVSPGLIDFLQGDAGLEQIVRPTASDNLAIIPRGTRRNRAPELLASELMNGLVQTMRAQFDVVIIDSPPLVAGIDAYALGAAAGSMLIVVRPGFTDRKLAAAKLAVVDRLPIRILGAVVNAAPGGSVYRYYGSDYPYGKLEQAADIATPDGLVLSN